MRSAAIEGVLEHGQLPDPEGQEINDLKERVAQLEAEMKAIIEAQSSQAGARD
jgi:hypothetical protein